MHAKGDISCTVDAHDRTGRNKMNRFRMSVYIFKSYYKQVAFIFLNTSCQVSGHLITFLGHIWSVAFVACNPSLSTHFLQSLNCPLEKCTKNTFKRDCVIWAGPVSIIYWHILSVFQAVQLIIVAVSAPWLGQCPYQQLGDPRGCRYFVQWLKHNGGRQVCVSLSPNMW